MVKGDHGGLQGFEGPEVDLAAGAPELYQQGSDGLQVQNGVGPELFRSREPGIVIHEQGLPEVSQEKTKDLNGKQPSYTSYFRSQWFVIASIALIIAIGLGVGLGVGLKKSNIANSGTNGSSGPLAPSNSTSPVFARGALNDTSLASVATPDGNRHIFLQDINGTLRHAIFSSVANLWLPDVDYLLPTVSVPSPRLGTPITATYPADPDIPNILVYYVNTNNTLSAISYVPQFGVIDGDMIGASIAIKPDSRCLTAATVQRNATDGHLYALLFFEAPSGNITFLYGQHGLDPDTKWEWQDMSEKLSIESLGEDIPLGCPCTSNARQVGNQSTPTDVGAAFFNPAFLENLSGTFATGLYFSNATDNDTISVTQDFGILNGDDGPSASDVLAGTGGVANISNTSDIISPFDQLNGVSYAYGLGLVVNESLRVVDHNTPPSRFPFGRLAWLSSNTSLYFYHQINESTLAEEEGINGAGWITRFIPISTS